MDGMAASAFPPTPFSICIALFDAPTELPSLCCFHSAAAIPIIIRPLDAGVHALLNATLRPVMKKYLCEKAGGKAAGLSICCLSKDSSPQMF
jgi:hypothetical protein